MNFNALVGLASLDSLTSALEFRQGDIFWRHMKMCTAPTKLKVTPLVRKEGTVECLHIVT